MNEHSEKEFAWCQPKLTAAYCRPVALSLHSILKLPILCNTVFINLLIPCISFATAMHLILGWTMADVEQYRASTLKFCCAMSK